MADAVYAIEDFPDDDLLWRIEWIGGVGYNTSVPSDPQIEICLAQLPAGETNPLSARSRVNCHIKCDWQWFWPNYVRLSLPQYLRLGEKIQETGLLVSLTGWL